MACAEGPVCGADGASRLASFICDSGYWLACGRWASYNALDTCVSTDLNDKQRGKLYSLL